MEGCNLSRNHISVVLTMFSLCTYLVCSPTSAWIWFQGRWTGQHGLNLISRVLNRAAWHTWAAEAMLVREGGLLHCSHWSCWPASCRGGRIMVKGHWWQGMSSMTIELLWCCNTDSYVFWCNSATPLPSHPYKGIGWKSVALVGTEEIWLP